MRAKWAIAAGVAMVLGTGSGAARAEVLDGRTARSLVFDPAGVQITLVRHGFLSDKEQQALEFAARQQKYYGAIAVAPSEGLLSEATVAAANYHDVGSASAAALKACDSARKGGKACVIAAEIRPAGWEPRPIGLSADATEGLRKTYRPMKAPKALAVSPATGIWAVASGASADRDAVADCARQSSAGDCRVVVADD
ncbi:MAG: 5-aminolevulic acid synthase [Rhodovulum sp.]